MNMETFAPEQYTLADRARSDERATFIMQTYLHLFGAIVATVVLEAILLVTIGEAFASVIFTLAGGWGWLIVLAVFIGMNYLAERWAHSSVSSGIQYAGLGLAVLAWSLMLLPVLYVAANFAGPEVIPMAAIITLCAFTGLTATAVLTRKNFNFLGPFLGMASLVLLGTIVAAVAFGFSLGLFFAGLVILLACGYILYHTSQVLHEYRIGQHVGAAVALYSSVALLFYYVLQFTILSRD